MKEKAIKTETRSEGEAHVNILETTTPHKTRPSKIISPFGSISKLALNSGSGKKGSPLLNETPRNWINDTTLIYKKQLNVPNSHLSGLNGKNLTDIRLQHILKSAPPSTPSATWKSHPPHLPSYIRLSSNLP